MPTQTCVGCTSNLHCYGQTPWCHPQLKRCGECNGTQGCAGATPHCDTRTGVARCVGCQSDVQCDPATPICDPGRRACVTSTIGRGCAGATPVCDIFVPGGACVECLADTHCGSDAPYCDLLRRRCVTDPVATGEQQAAGTNFSCGVNGDGGVSCWGYNTYGQLGDGSTLSHYQPAPVSALDDVKEVAAGGAFACARTSAPRLACWGYNTYGQLGNGSTTTSPTAVDVTGLSTGVLRVMASGYYSCALLASGEARCWGYNTYGQLGNGTTSASPTPVAVAGLSGILALALGNNHACALLSSGGVKCWGYNFYGQLGNGLTTNSTTPVDVMGLQSGVLAIAAGTSHTCALVMGGAVKCWGYNYYGQLGNGTTVNSPVPTDVQGLAMDAVSLTSGDNHACVRRQSGGMQCWGSNVYGQIGNGSTATAVPGATDVLGL